MLIFCENKILTFNGTYEHDSARVGLDILNSSRDLPENWQSLTPWIDAKIPELYDGENLLGLREVWNIGGDSEFSRVSGAWQFANWFRNVRICSYCGGELVPNNHDFGRKCTSCGRTFYAPQSPAIIVAVEHDGKLLLAHNAAWPENRCSIIAGFVEPGERLEEAVAREISEEVSISVSNVKYFGSQTWPFPNSLMLGFTAEYNSGEVCPDGEEITWAGFFTPEEIRSMNIPDGASIARRLIENFLATH